MFNKKIRFFRLICENGIVSDKKFRARTPKQAAKLVLSHLYKNLEILGPFGLSSTKSDGSVIHNGIKFSISECTFNSTEKTYFYIGSRESFGQSVVKFHNNTLYVTNKYKFIITKIKQEKIKKSYVQSYKNEKLKSDWLISYNLA